MSVSKYNTGDRFAIEIAEVMGTKNGKAMYRIKGFGALIFDDFGLDRLEQLEAPEPELPKIEACPYCGSGAVRLVGDFVECCDCNAMGPDMQTAHAAIIAWNRVARIAGEACEE